MQIALLKQKHMNERLIKENTELLIENKRLSQKEEVLKHVLLEFDKERFNEMNHENVRRYNDV